MSVIQNLSSVILPLILLVFSLVLLRPRANLFDSFVTGAKEGMESAIGLLPTLVLVMVGVNMLFSSGAVDILVSFLGPVFTFFGVPKEMLPNIILRPFSGSATTAVADKMFFDYGPDSSASKIASVLMGSTDTIVYTLALYFSAVKIKKTRYAYASSFLVFLFSIFVSIFTSKLFAL